MHGRACSMLWIVAGTTRRFATRGKAGLPTPRLTYGIWLTIRNRLAAKSQHSPAIYTDHGSSHYINYFFAMSIEQREFQDINWVQLTVSGYRHSSSTIEDRWNPENKRSYQSRTEFWVKCYLPSSCLKHSLKSYLCGRNKVTYDVINIEFMNVSVLEKKKETREKKHKYDREFKVDDKIKGTTGLLWEMERPQIKSGPLPMPMPRAAFFIFSLIVNWNKSWDKFKNRFRDVTYNWKPSYSFVIYT